jgi:hypothetical protein
MGAFSHTVVKSPLSALYEGMSRPPLAEVNASARMDVESFNPFFICSSEQNLPIVVNDRDDSGGAALDMAIWKVIKKLSKSCFPREWRYWA